MYNCHPNALIDAGFPTYHETPCSAIYHYCQPVNPQSRTLPGDCDAGAGWVPCAVRFHQGQTGNSGGGDYTGMLYPPAQNDVGGSQEEARSPSRTY